MKILIIIITLLLLTSCSRSIKIQDHQGIRDVVVKRILKTETKIIRTRIEPRSVNIVNCKTSGFCWHYSVNGGYKYGWTWFHCDGTKNVYFSPIYTEYRLIYYTNQGIYYSPVLYKMSNDIIKESECVR